MSPLLVFLLILLSMHACNARILKETKKHDFFTKDVEKVNLRQISIPSKTLRREEVGNMDESSVGANNIMNRDNLQPFLKEKEAILGDELILSWQKNLPHTTEIQQGLKKQERSLLRSSATSDTEEAVESNENDITGDVEVMDYAQPHRKPPIHNEKS